MMFETIVVGQLDTNCVVIADTITRDACVIDPGDEPEKISAHISGNNLRPAYILFTHAHYDHGCAARELKEQYHADIVMHEDEKSTYMDTKRLCVSRGFDEEDFPLPDIFVRDNDFIKVGNHCFRVIHTPGHMPGHISLYDTNSKTCIAADAVVVENADLKLRTRSFALTWKVLWHLLNNLVSSI